MTQRTFVLVHGAWHGGWCYAKVRDLLTAAGHRVFTPTLTGLADRSHLLSPEITLGTHIADIVNLVEWEGMDDIVLVGHSYGGWVISGAVEQLERRVMSIVFIDSYLPQDGESLADFGRPGAREEISHALRSGEAGRPAPPVETFGIRRPGDREWVASKMTAQPVGVSLDPISLTGARDRVPRKTYIRAPAYRSDRFDVSMDRVRNDPSWNILHVECGHDVMVDDPERLAEILLASADARQEIPTAEVSSSRSAPSATTRTRSPA